MFLHKHFLKGYLRELTTMRQEMAHYQNDSHTWANHQDHQRDFLIESENALKEIEKIQEENSKEDTQLVKIMTSSKFKNTQENHYEDFKNQLNNYNKLLIELIEMIIELNRKFQKQMSKFDTFLEKEVYNTFQKTEQQIKLLIDTSEYLASSIRNNITSINEEYANLKKEKTVLDQINHNIESWML